MGTPPTSAVSGDRLWALWRAALLLAMAVIAAVYAAVFLRYLAFPYGDLGWAIDHLVWNAWQMATGQPVYTDPALGNPTAFMYTPGFSLLLVPLVKLFGPELWTARVLNLIAGLLLILIVTREAARRVADRRLVWFAPGLVFLLGSANFSSLIVVHPEGWATVFALLALVAARRAAERGSGVGWAVLASVAAVATKQTTLLYVPIVAATFLAWGRPRAAAGYVGGVAVLLALGAALGQWATDGWFLKYVLLGAHHEMQWDQLPAVLGFMAESFGPYLALLLAGAALAGPRRRARELLRDPFLTALVVGLPIQAVVLLKRGNMPNHFFGLTMLLVPLVLEAVARLLPWLRARPRTAGWLAALCLGWAGFRLTQDLPPLWRNIEGYDDRVAVVQRLEQLVQQAQGSVWTPMGIALAYRNEAEVVAPVLIVSEFLPVMPEVIAPVLAQLDRGEFQTLLLPNLFFDLLPREQFEPSLRAHYRAVEVVGADAMMGTFTPVTVMQRRE